MGTEGWYVDDYLVQSCVAQTPNLTIDDLKVEEHHPEGLRHPATATFTVTLNNPAQWDVTANYQTADGTATGNADYTPNSGVLTIPTGAVTGTVDVILNDDALDEDDETFVLNLSNVAGANVVDGQGQATILNDDPLPALAVGDATATEGNSGAAPASFSLVLTPVSGREVTVDFTDVPGTASPGSDYLACSGTAVLPAGVRSAPISCDVLGDLKDEADESFGVALSNPANATLADPQAAGLIVDDDPVADLLSGRELVHGFDVVYDLAAQPGPVSDQDWFRIGQAPYSSYEIAVDGAGGDTRPLQLQRVGMDGITVLQAAADAGPGEARSLRFENATGSTIVDERIRVASGGCGTDCGADDVYRLRAYDTTGSIARFNNSSTQVTVLLFQNSGAATVAGHVWFWRPDGSLASSLPFSVDPGAQLVVDTSSLLPGEDGSMTVSHDGPYAALLGKAVAVEPLTGFSFDTPLTYTPK